MPNLRLNPDQLKAQVKKEIDLLREVLVDLSLKIHSNPELKFREFKASGWLISILRDYDFEIEEGIHSLDTAFRATAHGLSENPRVAFLAEYDALPEMGHGCGHNLIATASIGAALGVKSVIKTVPGSIQLLGTPGEEGGGGKTIMVKNGIFDDVDAALMFHPANKTIVLKNKLALKELKVKFFGKSAHPSVNPEKGINALDATIQTFNNIHVLCKRIKDGGSINGIIVDGGKAPNIIPDYSSSQFYIRACKDDYCERISEEVKNCARGASIATGAKVKFESQITYRSSKFNLKLAEVFKKNLENVGERVDEVESSERSGSTDMGDVSQRVPAIHPYIAIGPNDLVLHSREFAEASISSRANDVIIKAAKALAMTAIDIFAKPEILKEIKDGFQSS